MDDLVALAVAFDTTPAALLLPDTDNGEPVPLTETTSGSFAASWQWMRAESPLGEPEAAEEAVPSVRAVQFAEENHPDRPPGSRHSPAVNDMLQRAVQQVIKELERKESDDDGR